MHGQEITPRLETGLGWHSLIVCLCNPASAYLRQRFGKDPRAYVWYVVGAVFFVLALLNFFHAGLALPEWLKDWADFGAQRGLEGLGAANVARIATYVTGLYLVALIPLALMD